MDVIISERNQISKWKLKIVSNDVCVNGAVIAARFKFFISFINLSNRNI